MLSSVAVHAAIVTEYWEADVYRSDVTSMYEVNDKFRWSIKYDDESLSFHDYSDGDDGLAYTGDNETIAFTYTLGDFGSDAEINFPHTLAEFSSAANLATHYDPFYHNQYRFGYTGGAIYHQFSIDDLWFKYDFSSNSGYLGARGSGNVDLKYVRFENAIASAVPVPAAVWLFGSGLIGLIGIARRKKS
jgi:hypothetical protein